MIVETTTGTWIVPPHRAVWIESGFEHAIRTTGPVRMRSLYFRRDLAPRLPESCCVIGVTPLLRELILESLRLGMLSDAVAEHERLAAVLLDQLTHTRQVALQLRLPSDVRARRVAAKAQCDLATTKSLPALVRDCGASMRTIERLFVRETGMTLGRWMQQARALHALERLAAGDSVTSAGLAVGYDSTSAFIAMFKRVLGTTPGSYFSDFIKP